MELREYDLFRIFLISLIVILGASEFGHRLGLRVGVRGADNISTIESAILGLLALMIGFTFAMALSLFEMRREAVLSEANAIGTTALRARLLPAPYDANVSRLLREYVQLRIGLTDHAATAAEWKAALERSNALQEALWQQATAVAAVNDAMVPTGVFIQALNGMLDEQEKRLTAARNQVPNIVLWALYGVATVASAFAGYASGLRARRWRVPVYLMAILVSAVILLIQDLDRPTAGFVAYSEQPMLDVAAMIVAFPE